MNKLHVIARPGVEGAVEDLAKEQEDKVKSGLGEGDFAFPATVHKGIEGLGEVSSTEARGTRDKER